VVKRKRKRAEHLLGCCWWEAEHEHHFVESIDVTNVFKDYTNLLDFLI